MELDLELAHWLLRSGAGQPRYVAAVLTATAVPVATSSLLALPGVVSEMGLSATILAIVLGIAFGVRSEGLGLAPLAVRDWALVTTGAMVAILAVFGFILFIGLIGSLAGSYLVAAASGAWLVLRMAIALAHRLSAWHERPA